MSFLSARAGSLMSRCSYAARSIMKPSNQLPTPSNSVIVRTFANKKHKRFLRKYAKGYRGRSKNCYSIAIRRVMKAWQNSYRDRKLKKREFSKLWIQRINAGVRQYSWRYSQFFGEYRKSGMTMDRKILADLAATEPFAFRSVVQVVEHQHNQRKLASNSE